MIEFKCGEAASFQFEMQVTGDLQGTPAVCFCIKVDDRLALTFKAHEKGQGVYGVDVPALDKYMHPGTYPCEISVILGDHYYVPAVDTCNLRETPKPVVSGISMTSTAPAAPAIKITMTPPPATAPEASPAPFVPAAAPDETVVHVEAKKVDKPAKPVLKSEDTGMLEALLGKKKS